MSPTERPRVRRHANAGWTGGYVEDGRVEAVFEGRPSDVESMVQWCHEGSPAAEVDDVAVEYEEPSGITGFSVKR